MSDHGHHTGDADLVTRLSVREREGACEGEVTSGLSRVVDNGATPHEPHRSNLDRDDGNARIPRGFRTCTLIGVLLVPARPSRFSSFEINISGDIADICKWSGVAYNKQASSPLRHRNHHVPSVF